MDPSGVVLTAIAAGVENGLEDSAKDAISSLVGKIKNFFLGDEDALADLNRYSRKPSPELGEDVRAHLEAHGVGRDDELVAEARSILEKVGPTATGAGSLAAGVVSQSVSGGGSAYAGGTHTITNNYNQPPSSPAAPKWSLTWHRGDKYMLENVGDGPAYDVTLEAPKAIRFDKPERDDPTWEAGDARTFLIAQSFNFGSGELVVTYAQSPGGEAKVWRRDFPSKE